MTSVRYVAGMDEREKHRGSWWQNLKEGDQLKDLGIDRKILKWALEK